MDEQIRPVQLGDEVGLQAACFPVMTVDEVKSEIVTPAFERANGRGHVVLVASRSEEIRATLTISPGSHRLTKHGVGMGGFVVAPAARGTGLDPPGRPSPWSPLAQEG